MPCAVQEVVELAHAMSIQLDIRDRWGCGAEGEGASWLASYE